MIAKSTCRARLAALRALLLVALVAVVPRPGAAQDDREARYRALVEQAITAYEARDFNGAWNLFLQAHMLSGNARTLRGLGMVAFELRDYAVSVDRLEQALAAPERPLEGVLRADTEALLARARSFVAQIALRIEPEVAAQVRIDGAAARLDDAQRVRVTVGDHAIEIAAPGFGTERRMFTAVGGEELTLVVRLRRLAPNAQQTARAGFVDAARADNRTARDGAAAAEEGGGVLTSPWFWSAVVLVVGGGVTAGVLIATSEDEVEPPLAPRSGVTVNALELAP